MGFFAWPPFWRIFTITLGTLTLFNWFWPLAYGYISFIGGFFALPHVSWYLAKFMKRNLIVTTYVSPANKAVLITGCDSGFGNLVARSLDVYGFHVFAGCLSPDGDGAQRLIEQTSRRLRVVKLDVTRDEDVQRVVRTIKESGLDLWGLVNNAGIADYVPVEWGEGIKEFEKMFSVNVFGVVRITKACLPLLRKAKGRVVNISSVTGRFAFSGITHYCMTKFAVRSFSDGLRREMYPFGVKVVTVEPMMYATNIMNTHNLTTAIDTVWSETPEDVRDDYGLEFREKFKSRLFNSLKTCRTQVEEVVEAIEKGITESDPEINYRCCGPGERPALWALEQTSLLAQDVVLTGPIWAKFLKLFSVREKNKK